MGHVKNTLLLAAFLIGASILPAQDAKDLLREVSARYDALKSYEFTGILSTSLPGTGCTLEFGISVSASLPEFPQVTRIHADKLPKTCIDPVAKLGSVSTPGEWSYFNTISAGFVAINELPQQILEFPGQEIRCTILEVLYDAYYRKLGSYDGPIRYWVDTDSHLIRRVQFTEMTAQGPRDWTATLETVRIGGPPASWLVDSAHSWTPPSLIGEAAPDIELRRTDGELVRLGKLRGRVVVLDFWATWCYACMQEIPTLEKFQTEKTVAGVTLLGVTQEGAVEVTKWLSENKRSFLTLVDAKKAFDEYKVGHIPVLVIINKQGVVAEYDVGFHSEQAVREIIRRQLSN